LLYERALSVVAFASYLRREWDEVERVLSAFPLMLLDYYGFAGFKENWE
jgi:hypothetical protein